MKLILHFDLACNAGKTFKYKNTFCLPLESLNLNYSVKNLGTFFGPPGNFFCSTRYKNSTSHTFTMNSTHKVLNDTKSTRKL